MSYIRAGSNPERLYIWEGDAGVTIAIGGTEVYETIPVLHFDRLLIKSYINGTGSAKYRELEVDEKSKPGKIRLLYQGSLLVELYDSTWGYLVLSKIDHWRSLNKIRAQNIYNVDRG